MLAKTLGASGIPTPPSVLISTIGRLLSVKLWENADNKVQQRIQERKKKRFIQLRLTIDTKVSIIFELITMDEEMYYQGLITLASTPGTWSRS